jgi:hypothetical protein
VGAASPHTVDLPRMTQGHAVQRDLVIRFCTDKAMDVTVEGTVEVQAPQIHFSCAEVQVCATWPASTRM